MAGERGDTNLRLFVAAELPDDVRSALAAAIAVLQRAGMGEAMRWVRPEGVHLTLKFLGAVAAGRERQIIDALAAGLRGVAPFTLQPEGLGTFHAGKGWQPRYATRPGYHYNMRVVWVGLGDTTALDALARRVEGALAPFGFPADEEPFLAHLTLGRVRDDAGRAAREALFRAAEPYLSKGTRTGRFDASLVPPFPPLPVTAVSLMQSTLRPGGAVYAARATFPLEG